MTDRDTCATCGKYSAFHECLPCSIKRDKMQAAWRDIESGRSSLQAATARYGVTSVELVQWRAKASRDD